MGSPIEMTLIGGEALAAQLGQLGKRVSGQVVRQALTAAAKPIQAAARAAAPVDTGLLARSMAVKGKQIRPGLTAMVVTTTCTRKAYARAHGSLAHSRKGAAVGSGRYAVFYASFVEYGHRIGKHTAGKVGSGRIKPRKGAATGGSVDVPAEPFMRPAFDANEAAAITIISDELSRGIDAAL